MKEVELPFNPLYLQETHQKPLPGTIVPCLMCGKPFLMRIYSGEPDQLCAECWKTYRDCASLVCTVCNITIAKVLPGITDDGFLIRRNSVLHVDACNVCQPDIKKSVVIEIADWNKGMGLNRRTIVNFGGHNAQLL